jgi:hypothetical protein
MKSWKMNEKNLTLQMDESCKQGWNLFKNFVGFLKLDHIGNIILDIKLLNF